MFIFVANERDPSSQGEEEVVRKGAVAALRFALMEKERATRIWRTQGKIPGSQHYFFYPQ